MPHALRVAVLVCLLGLPAPGFALTVDFSGTIDTVSDSFGALDGSVVRGGAVSGTYQVVPSSSDMHTPFGVGPAQLTFQLGNYLFDQTQDHAISLIDNQDTGIPGVTTDHWQSREIVKPDLSPSTSPSGSSVAYAAQIDFFDSESDQFDGNERAPFVPADLMGWEISRLTLNSVDNSGTFNNRVKVQVNIDNWNVVPVPEPRSAALVLFGLASLAHRARKRAR